MTNIEYSTREKIVKRSFELDSRFDELVTEYAQLAYAQACIDQKDPVEFLKEVESFFVEGIHDSFKSYLRETE